MFYESDGLTFAISAMYGVLIFDCQNDVIFVDGDPGFHEYIVDRCLKEGLLRNKEPEDARTPEWQQDFNNAIVQLFAPLVTSQRILISHFSNPYTSVQCQDDTIFTFSEYFGFTFVAIGIGFEIKEANLNRRLQTFVRLTTLLCGPMLNNLRLSSADGSKRQSLLRRLHETWLYLYDRVFAFLIEAEDRLVVNSDLTSTCLKLLHDSMAKFKAGGGEMVNNEWTPVHLLLTVNTKVLAMYSGKNGGELSEADVLMLVLLACTLHSTHIPNLDTSNEIQEEEGGATRGSSGRSSCGSDDNFHSSRSSPVSIIEPVERFELSENWSNVPLTRDPNSPSAIPVDEVAISADENLTATNEKLKRLRKSKSRDEFVEIYGDFHCHLVFLESSENCLTPHVICTSSIMPGMVLLLVFKASNSKLYSTMIRTVEKLHSVSSGPNSKKSERTIESIEKDLKYITESCKKLKGNINSDKFVKRIASRWNQIKKNGLIEFIKSKKDKHLSSSLESALVHLNENLKGGLQKFCIDLFQPKSFVSKIDNILIDVQSSLRFCLVDYIDYLDIKAMHNITVPTYYRDYPGLVHFIHIDRLKNQISVQTIDDCTAINSDHLSQKLMHKKVIQMVQTAWSHLQMGHLSFSWKDDNFVYSYFLWFEDMMGNSKKPDRPLLTLENFPSPGVISGNFYRKLVKEYFPNSFDKIKCFELFCIHSSDTDASAIVSHAKLLASTIWESSGCDQSLVDLL